MTKHWRIKRILTTLLLIITMLTTTLVIPSSAAEKTLSGNLFTHDPTVIKEGSTWWQFYTARGIGVKYSSDGLNWTEGSKVFQQPLSWWFNYTTAKVVDEVWAPEIYFHNNRYWLYYSYSEFGTNKSLIGLTSCSSISLGDWRDDGLVIASNSTKDYNCIDPGITKDTAGNLWMSFGSFYSGIKIVQLNTSTMKPYSNPTIYSIATRPGVQYNPIEGAKIIYHDGYYYMFVAFDFCCQGGKSTYKIAYGRSTSIKGPYVDKSGTSMMNGGGTILEQSDARFIGPGGPEPFFDGNSWVMVRFAYDGYNNHTPTLRIGDLYFDADKWPSYNQSSGYYKIQNRGYTTLFIDGMGATANGSDVVQWSSSTNYNQQFEIINSSGRFYKLRNRSTGLFVDSMGLTAAGSNAGQWSGSSSTKQQWELINAGDGYVKIRNVATGLYLDNGGQSTNGSVLKMYGDSTSYNLQWKLHKQ